MKLFISYAHVDIAQVRQIVEILRAGGHEPWFDHKLLPGQDWQAELRKSIHACESFLYALTPESVDSEWCQWEFAEAVKMGKPIIPVLLQSNTTLPEAIRRFQYADFCEGVNPINVAQLMGGLSNITVTIRPSEVIDMPQNPAGKPAQAESIPESMTTKLDIVSADAVRAIIGDPFDWCEVPAGEFLYGEDKQKLTLPAFAIAKYPITYSQFQVFIEAKDGYLDDRWWEGLTVDAGHRKHPGNQKWKNAVHPRENVSWYDAIAFCRWLSFKLGHDYDLNQVARWAVRLPTEFEWEKAARGTDGRNYPYGGTFDETKCNIVYSRIKKTTPVTRYPQGASPYGVLDMSGNLWEWCLTDYENPVIDIEKDTLYSIGPRILRGGAWNVTPSSARVVSRGADHPYDRSNNTGFRICAAPIAR